MHIFKFFKRLYSSSKTNPKICIVGGGPAGFYAAQHLIKKLKNVQVDIYEKLPVPFGLVRFGVAPDHPEVKNVINTFSKTAESEQVNFIGNVNVGEDVSIKQLKDAYHIVLLTYGADKSKTFGIPGENLKNVISARNIVGWYNGTPWNSNLDMDLSGESVAVLGQGNVAIDVARILLSPIDELSKTDITQHALEKLSNSKIKKVYLIGRRGPLQAAFTIKELREMLKLKNCNTVWRKDDFSGVSELVSSLARPKKRISELMLNSLNQMGTSGSKTFYPIFFRSPLEILGDQVVEKILLGVNRLEGTDFLSSKAVMTEKREEIPCNLVITSIGYKSHQIDKDIPFDNSKGVAINENSKIEKGFYTSGWLATGPTGVILTTMGNAFGTANLILNDIEKEGLAVTLKPGFEEIEKILKVKNTQLVLWKDWLKIDKYEKLKGKHVGKPREKIIDVQEMLKVAS
ncbi:unnamed protein product [Brassicogethes aeneus]|uniref:NADPH:adrenodoxin oxidoreductase, mitochondrial n=1 Tax=Brassicogethes aeneus TaxID=1431903 RepID=A0A9P0BAS3_BRAAE|nr:unnamed protein product [Brassicogethes aeneus]